MSDIDSEEFQAACMVSTMTLTQLAIYLEDRDVDDLNQDELRALKPVISAVQMVVGDGDDDDDSGGSDFRVDGELR